MWALKEGEVKTVKKDLKPNITGLTPSPSPRGEGSDMPCALTTCCWLTYYLPASPQPLLASPQPLPASPPTPLQGERGVICLVH